MIIIWNGKILFNIYSIYKKTLKKVIVDSINKNDVYFSNYFILNNINKDDDNDDNDNMKLIGNKYTEML